MLGKLFKHDMIATGRLLLPIHGILIAFTLVQRLFFHIDFYNVSNQLSGIKNVTYTIYIIFMVFTFAVTFIYLLVYFQKNMYGDEGYLTFTLPVNTWQLIASKLLSSLLWSVIDIFVVGGCIFFLSYDAAILPYISRLFSEAALYFIESGSNIYTFVILIILVLVFSLVEWFMIFYLSMSVGQLANTHKKSVSIGAFFGITIILQIVFNIISIPFISLFYSYNEVEMLNTVSSILLYSLFAELIVSAVCWILTTLIMQKKLNLA